MGKKESVWDYPRPPRLEKFSGELKVVFSGISNCPFKECLPGPGNKPPAGLLYPQRRYKNRIPEGK